MALFSNLKKAFCGESGRFQVADRIVVCSHCGGTEFKDDQAQLNTAGATYFGYDWLNRSAHALICTNCGHIEWFLQ